MKLILATGNAHKAREIAALIGGAAEVLTLKEAGFDRTIVEDGQTFEENARIKLACLWNWYRTQPCFQANGGVVLLADDSGLEVDSLGGEPGVRSARYAGEPSDDSANNAKLLRALAGLPGWKRTAQFRCVLAAMKVAPPGSLDPVLFEGICRGKVGFQPKGGHGFGYDPIFFPEGFCRTYAEIGDEEKNQISHRARAMAEFKEWFAVLRQD